MFFTKDDFKRIEDWLKHRTIRDTEFPPASEFTGRECFPIVQTGENRIASFCQIVSRIAPDFLNTTLDKKSKTLNDAACSIPLHRRKLGLVITFFTEKGNWAIYQFKGDNLNQWTTNSCWRNIYDEAFDEFIKLYPDEEDITEVIDDGKSYIKFKDRFPDSLEFIGRGKLILRRNITGSLACAIDDEDHYVNILTQEMVSRSNMIYVVQYDFDLNGESIVIPSNCTLLFQGGSFNNGSLVLSKTSILGAFKYSDIGNVNILGSFTTGQVMAFTDEDRTILKWYDGTEWKPLLDITDYKAILDKIIEVVTEYNNILEQKINNKINLINNKIDSIDSSISNITKDITNIEGDISNINNSIESINTTIENINNSGDTTNNNITEINNRIEDIKNDITHLNETINNITSIGGDVSGLIEQITDINSRLNNLVEEVETIKNNGGGSSGGSDITEERVQQLIQEEINKNLSNLESTINQYIQNYIEETGIASGATSITVKTPSDTQGKTFNIDDQNNITIEVPDGTDSVPVSNKTLTVTQSGKTLGTYNGEQDVIINIPESTGGSGGDGEVTIAKEPLLIVDSAGNPLMENPYTGESATVVEIPAPFKYNKTLTIKSQDSTLSKTYNGSEDVEITIASPKLLTINNYDGELLAQYDTTRRCTFNLPAPPTVEIPENKDLTIKYSDSTHKYNGKEAVDIVIPEVKDSPIIFIGTLSRNHVKEEFTLAVNYQNFDILTKSPMLYRDNTSDNPLYLSLESKYSVYIGGAFTNIERYTNEDITDPTYDNADIRYTTIQTSIIQNKTAVPRVAIRGIGSRLKSSLMSGEDLSSGVALNPLSTNNVDYILRFSILVVGKKLTL